MKVLRRLVALLSAAAFCCFSTQAFDLHVHAHDQELSGHQHGPASHHHNTRLHLPLNLAHIGAVDADDTVVPVLVCAQSTVTPRTVALRAVVATAVTTEPPQIIADTIVVVRVHGPPSIRPDSLRAPPATIL